MQITIENIVYYLISRGLLTREKAIEGGITAVDISRRNKNIKVELPDKTGYFVKQLKTNDQQSIISISREATCFGLSLKDSDFSSLKHIIPSFVDYNPNDFILITELLPEGKTLTEYHQQKGEFSIEIAQSLGEALGIYHREVGHKMIGDKQNGIFPKIIPWIFSFPQQGKILFPNLSGGNQEIQAIINRYPDYQQKLSELQKEWKINGLIHGDMKWDNVIVYKEQDQTKLKVVDWELSDFGDIAWDTASILQAYLTFWIIHMPQHLQNVTEQIAEAKYPLSAMQPAINHFWNTYTDVLEVKGEERNKLLERCTRYAAARMIQTAFEYLYYANQSNSHTTSILQMSLNILSKPEEAIKELLNIKS